MRWKHKARVQNAVACLPTPISKMCYYRLQRHFGALRSINPMSRLQAATALWDRLIGQGIDPVDKRFLEVGTGWVPVAPIAYWLMGANNIVTVDLNRYMRTELISDALNYIAEHITEVQDTFGNFLNNARFRSLLDFQQSGTFTEQDFLNLCEITYIAPGNAADTKLAPESIDFHTSLNVFEHIPPDVLTHILHEGGRILRKDGLFAHWVDYSDHFSHSDPSISAINFLQFSDSTWDGIAGNRFMYMNRLRHDDFVALFSQNKRQIILNEPGVDARAESLLKSNSLKIDKRFREKSIEILGVHGAWLFARKAGRN